MLIKNIKYIINHFYTLYISRLLRLESFLRIRVQDDVHSIGFQRSNSFPKIQYFVFEDFF